MKKVIKTKSRQARQTMNNFEEQMLNHDNEMPEMTTNEQMPIQHYEKVYRAKNRIILQFFA